MHNDDSPVGTILTRREVLATLGAGAVAGVAAWSAGMQPASAANLQPPLPGCVVRPQATEGPYFVDQQLERSDIRIEPASGAEAVGVPLALAFAVSSVAGGSCSPLSGAVIDVWQCDAAGVYSGVADTSLGLNTVGKKALRGLQRTGRGGLARFTTIYPGWYSGRPVHIHFKIRTTVAGQPYEFTSQLYFEEALTDRIHARAPYAARGRRDTRNETDTIFRRGGGTQLVLDVTERGAGLAAQFNVALDLSDAAAGRPDGFRTMSSNRGRRGA